MIDSMRKLDRSTPKLILLVLIQIFQHLLEESVSEKASHHWSVVECRRESQLYSKKHHPIKDQNIQGVIKVIAHSLIKIYCEKMSRAPKDKKYFTRCFTKKNYK